MTKSTISRCLVLLCAPALLLGLLVPALPFLAVTASAVDYNNIVITLDGDNSIYDSYSSSVDGGIVTHSISSWSYAQGYTMCGSLRKALNSGAITYLYTSNSFNPELTNTASYTQYFIDKPHIYFAPSSYNGNFDRGFFDISSFIGDGVESAEISFSVAAYYSSNGLYYSSSLGLYCACYDANFTFLSNNYLSVSESENSESDSFTMTLTIPEGTCYIVPYIFLTSAGSLPSGVSLVLESASFDLVINSYFSAYKANIYSSDGTDLLMSAKNCDAFSMQVTNTGAVFTFADGTSEIFTYSGDDVFLGFSPSAGGSASYIPGETYSIQADTSLYCVGGAPPSVPVITESFSNQTFEVVRGGDLSFSLDSVSANGELSYQWYMEYSDGTVKALDSITDTLTFKGTVCGDYYIYCEVTNLLNGLSESAATGKAHISVIDPSLPSNRVIYNYFDFVDLKEIVDSGIKYISKLPYSGMYSEFYGGIEDDREFVDYWLGSSFTFEYPFWYNGEGMPADDVTYYLDFDMYSLGFSSQGLNMMRADNIINGVPVNIEYIFSLSGDSTYSGLNFVVDWYSSDFKKVGSSSFVPSFSVSADDPSRYVCSVSFDWYRPSGAKYCVFYLSCEGFHVEEYHSFDVTLHDFTMDVVLPSSSSTDNKIDDIGGAIDGVGDKIDGTNERLDDILSGGEAGEELSGATDQFGESNEQLGGIMDDYASAGDALPDVPDSMSSVVNGGMQSFADSDVDDFMPWNDAEYVFLWDILAMPALSVLAIALLFYVVFGRAKSG